MESDDEYEKASHILAEASARAAKGNLTAKDISNIEWASSVMDRRLHHLRSKSREAENSPPSAANMSNQMRARSNSGERYGAHPGGYYQQAQPTEAFGVPQQPPFQSSSPSPIHNSYYATSGSSPPPRLHHAPSTNTFAAGRDAGNTMPSYVPRTAAAAAQYSSHGGGGGGGGGGTSSMTFVPYTVWPSPPRNPQHSSQGSYSQSQSQSQSHGMNSALDRSTYRESSLPRTLAQLAALVDRPIEDLQAINSHLSYLRPNDFVPTTIPIRVPQKRSNRRSYELLDMTDESQSEHAPRMTTERDQYGHGSRDAAPPKVLRSPPRAPAISEPDNLRRSVEHATDASTVYPEQHAHPLPTVNGRDDRSPPGAGNEQSVRQSSADSRAPSQARRIIQAPVSAIVSDNDNDSTSVSRNATAASIPTPRPGLQAPPPIEAPFAPVSPKVEQPHRQHGKQELFHKVELFDTIETIAKEYGVHPDVVYECNPNELLHGSNGVVFYRCALPVDLLLRITVER